MRDKLVIFYYDLRLNWGVMKIFLLGKAKEAHQILDKQGVPRKIGAKKLGLADRFKTKQRMSQCQN